MLGAFFQRLSGIFFYEDMNHKSYSLLIVPDVIDCYWEL